MNVLWITNIPSPYRVDFFNELGKYCDLTVLFERQSSTERDKSWKSFQAKRFTAVFLGGKSIGAAEAFCPSVVKYISRHYDHIVVTNYSDPTGILAILFMQANHIPYEIESDGAFPGIGKGIKETVKKILISHATLCFSTATIHDNYYLTYGADKKRIVRYPFTSVFKNEILANPLTLLEKNKLKTALGISEEFIILAVGQFIHRKGYDVLLNSIADLPGSIGVYIVGGIATDEYKLLKRQLHLDHLHFLDFKPKMDLHNYYLAADVFVHPTREDIWGLVINEAIANGLPVITTDRCIAGLQLVENGINGRIIPSENIEQLRNSIIESFNHPYMPERSLKIAAEYTIEKMAQRHIEIWKYKI